MVPGISAMTLQQSFALALQHHQSGRLAEAEVLYRQILAAQPRQADTLHQLGLLAHQTGHHSAAAELVGEAVAVAPENPVFQSNLATVLFESGRLDEAIAAYRRTIQIEPGYAGAHNSLGHALTLKGELAEAIAACRRAIELQPDYAMAHNNLGNALGEQGRTDEAISSFRRALQLRPEYAEACHNLALSLRQKGLIREAVVAWRRAIEIKPDYPAACHALGDALTDVRRFEEAVTVYRQALQVSEIAETQNNLGLALFEQGRLEDSMTAFRRALELKPEYAPAWFNTGHALEKLSRLEEAIAAYRRAIDLKADFPEAFNNLGSALKDQGHLEEAIAAYRQAIALKPDYAGAHSNLAYCLLFHSGSDPESLRQELHQWNQQHAEPRSRFIQPHGNDRTPERRLRIGYVSPDFRDHVVGRNILPILARHDHARFEVFCYSAVTQPDAFTRRFKQAADVWRDVAGTPEAEVAQLIRNDRIDILVDLTLHMAGNRLPVFARKPAPVQVTFAGYPGSTGLGAIDYRFSDPHLDPPGTDETLYSEQTVRLPHSFWCYDPLDCSDIPVNALPAGKNSFITFGCLNNYCKINGSMLRLWAKVLHQVSSSRLMLLAPEGSHRQLTLNVLRQEGIASERIEFVVPQPCREYLELYHRIDLGLDTLPYNGHTTSLDSFWMGVPVVTQIGKTIVGRAGYCQLKNLNLPELIASTPDQFVQLAADLANDPQRLAHLRSTLRQRMERSPLMDAPRFARDIEAACREMWRKWCCGADSATASLRAVR